MYSTISLLTRLITESFKITKVKVSKLINFNKCLLSK